MMCVGEQIAQCDGECELAERVLLEDCHILDVLNTPEINDFLNKTLRVNCSDPTTYLIPTVPVDNSSCLSTAFLLDSCKHHEQPS